MADLDSLVTIVRSRRRLLDAQRGAEQVVKVKRDELKGKVSDLSASAEELALVTALLNSIGEDRQQQAQTTIEALVTKGLQTIFEPTLSFHIVQTTLGNSVTVDFVIRSNEGGQVVETSVLEARGGGLAATVGFLLRVVILLLSKSSTFPLLVLDESFAHVSDEYLPAVGAFLRELVDKTSLQIIMVTHQLELTNSADVVYKFEANQSGTKVLPYELV